MTRRSVIVLMVGVACIGTSCRFLEGPAATVRRFHVALDKGDIPGAIDCLSPKFVTQFGLDKIRAALQDAALKLKRKGGIKTFKVEREDVVGDVAEVKTLITTGNGENDSDTFKLARENRVWRIQSPK